MKMNRIRKRTGDIEEFNTDKISHAIVRAIVASEEEIKDPTVISRALAEKVVTSLKQRYILSNVKKFNNSDPVAQSVLEIVPTVEEVQDVVEDTIWSAGYKMAARSYIGYRRKHGTLREIKQGILQNAAVTTTKFGVNPLIVLKSRYLQKDDAGNPIEGPEALMRRVAEFVAGGERPSERQFYSDKFYQELVNCRFVPNTPTLANAGRDGMGNLSACFVVPIDGTFEGVFKAIHDCAIIFKEGGGVGMSFASVHKYEVDVVEKRGGLLEVTIEDDTNDIFGKFEEVAAYIYGRDGDAIVDFSALRQDGDIVRSTQGIASGPVSFMKIFDAGLSLINEETRAGCIMCALHVGHPDVEVLMREAGAFNDVVPIVLFDDAFVSAVREGREWPLVSPRTGEVIASVNATSLYKDIKAATLRSRMRFVNKDEPGCWKKVVDECCTEPGTMDRVFSPSLLGTMHLFDRVIQEVKQGGIRRGAGMIVCPVDHIDILDFVRSKSAISVDGRRVEPLQNVNISVLVTDEFMDAYFSGGELRTREPGGRMVDTLPAEYVWDEIVYHAHAVGDPGLLFDGPINAKNPCPHIGRIRATNPCGELPLKDNGACVLGSVNVSKFFIKGLDGREEGWGAHVNLAALEETVRLGVRFLDDVIDVSVYPTPAIHDMVHDERNIGLGSMGWADLFFQMRLPYGSDLSIDLIDFLDGFIHCIAIDESDKLGKERGTFPAWPGSIYDPSSEHFRGVERLPRNATVTTKAPTGTISMVADCSSGVEPAYLLMYEKNVGPGVFTYENEHLRNALYDAGVYTNDLVRKIIDNGGVLAGLDGVPNHIKRVFVTTHEIAPEDHLRVQQAFQKHTCNAISKTINLPHDAGRDDVRKIYEIAAMSGLKGVTVFRDGCKHDQVYRRVKRKCENPDEDCGGIMVFDGKCYRCNSCGYSSSCSL